jgi:hypothetical protein
MNNPKFIHSKDGKVTICIAYSKGEQFKGIARCNEGDTLNPELGNQIAQRRAELAIRQRDLNEIRLFKREMKDWCVALGEAQSKLWTLAYQSGCDYERKQLKHIRNLKDQIKKLCNGIQ